MSIISFSIIIPTFNRPQLLNRAIESILNQTYNNFEIIIINDGSTQYLEEYSQLKDKYSVYKQIFFFDKNNSGVSATRNFGITKATGEYICFLDDDDYYLPNHLQCLNDLIKSTNYIPGFYRTFGLLLLHETKDKLELTHKADNEHSVIYILQNLVLPINICLNKFILEKHKFNEKIKYGEDYELWIRILIEFPLFESYKYTAVYDRTRETASTGSIKKYWEYVKTFELIFSNQKLKSIVPNNLRKQIFEKYYSWIISNYAINGEFRKNVKLLPKLIRSTSSNFVLKTYFANLFRSLIN